MKRRTFIRTSAMAGMALSPISFLPASKTHLLSLSFDDGFKDSFYRIAEIHEEFGLKACLNVIASAHIPEWNPPNDYHNPMVGNFDDWNALKSRGHEIMPHSWAHKNLTELPCEEAMALIDRCLDYFEANLDGFRISEAVYNFAYNASTPELEGHALKRVRAVRTGGWDILGQQPANPFPSGNGPFRLGCWSYGPDNADQWVRSEIDKFLATSGGWLILNLHGLDEEGWGPVSSSFLEDLLRSLVKKDHLEVIPVGAALVSYANE